MDRLNNINHLNKIYINNNIYCQENFNNFFEDFIPCRGLTYQTKMDCPHFLFQENIEEFYLM